MPLSTIFHLIMAVSFIGGGNRSTQRKPQTSHKSLTSFLWYLASWYDFDIWFWNCSDIVVRFVFHCIIYNNIFVGRHHRGSDHTDVVSLNLSLKSTLIYFDQLLQEKSDKYVCLFVCLIMFNATFNNISLNHGSQFYWWRKSEYPEKTTDLSWR
jgi:hypothetical protein